MKKGLLTLTMVMVLLTGCSMLQEVNTTLTYVTEATDFLNDANQFAEQVPVLAEQALTNPETLDTLKQELEAMKQEILDFNGLATPAFAEELHQQIVGYNEMVMNEINGYLQQINDQVIDLEAIANAPMLETIRNMVQLMNELEQLGQ